MTNDNIKQPPRTVLVVGPVLYHWTRQALTNFYADVADSPADAVVLGEVVCSRRREYKAADWFSLAQELRQAGKEVVLGTQALVESEAELRTLRERCAQDDFLVEAGDASALRRLQGRRFSLSPHVNVYSREALQEHAALGAVRWVPPVELDLAAIARINPPGDPVRTPQGEAVETELFAFGRMPLAFSARCFTARHLKLPKDECEFRCLADPDGLLLKSTEGQDFLVLNGIQTQSAGLQCVLDRPGALRAAGVRRLRLSPCAEGFMEVLRLHEAVFNEGADAAQALAALQGLALPGALVNGYAMGRPGLEWTRA
ncbi:U32 family peptidase [Azohydromonas aeria]|uniref:U32 family peptidase n=1 Tax=Azohydromonas aeria TaxID=2590212 RepID=UPI001E59D87F|nr:U32 family peptidase [Azohydromonas aeria]